MKNKKYITLTSTSMIIATPLIALSCSSEKTDAMTANEFISEANKLFVNDYNVLNSSTVNLDKLNVPKTGNSVEVFYTANTGDVSLDNWKLQNPVRNASYWAFADTFDQIGKKMNITVNFDKSKNEVLHTMINGGTEELPDFLIVSEKDIFSFMKYQYNGKSIFHNVTSDALPKSIITQPLINIVDYPMLNEVLKLEAREKNQATTSLIDQNGHVLINQPVTADPSVANLTVANRDKFNEWQISAEDYITDADAVYRSTQLFDSIAGVEFGTGFDFAGATTLEIMKDIDHATVNAQGIYDVNPEAIKNLIESIGHGINVKMPGDNNYNTGMFSDRRIISDITKGFSYNYIKSNPNLAIVPLNGFEGMDDKYILTLESGDANREALKQEMLDYLYETDDSHLIEYNRGWGDKDITMSYDEYYALWSKSRAITPTVRAKLMDINTYTSDLRETFALDGKDVNLLIAMNSIPDAPSQTYNEMKLESPAITSIESVMQKIMVS